MAQSVVILGRQPDLGLAELESLFGPDKIQRIGREAAIIDIDPADIPFARLGGTIKLAKLLTKLDTTKWNDLSDYVIEHVPKHTCCIGPGKLIFGISVYGVKTNTRALLRTTLSVKKAVVASDKRAVRVVPNKTLELSSAQVLHNKMTEPPLGMELLFIQDGAGVYLAQTVAVQDIEAYARRDQNRPKRDARVGMLPPKLAQIITNLAVGQTEVKTILDPFCGTGVVLQEALLMGYDAFGTDLEPRMIEYSEANLQWLRHSGKYRLDVGDATDYDWKGAFDTIACETYLGRPFSALPDRQVLKQVIQDVDTIHKKFLRNLARQTKAGFRCCIAVPAWKTQYGFMHLPVLDHLTDMGYTRVSFKCAVNENLIYHRDGQIVGRELVVLTRK